MQVGFIASLVTGQSEHHRPVHYLQRLETSETNNPGLLIHYLLSFSHVCYRRTLRLISTFLQQRHVGVAMDGAEMLTVSPRRRAPSHAG